MSDLYPKCKHDDYNEYCSLCRHELVVENGRLKNELALKDADLLLERDRAEKSVARSRVISSFCQSCHFCQSFP